MCSFPACFADGILPLDMEASELLSDTFEVLSSKEIKLLAMRSKADKDLLMEEDDTALANAVMQEAQKRLISQVSLLFHKWACLRPCFSVRPLTTGGLPQIQISFSPMALRCTPVMMFLPLCF